MAGTPMEEAAKAAPSVRPDPLGMPKAPTFHHSQNLFQPGSRSEPSWGLLRSCFRLDVGARRILERPELAAAGLAGGDLLARERAVPTHPLGPPRAFVVLGTGV